MKRKETTPAPSRPLGLHERKSTDNDACHTLEEGGRGRICLMVQIVERECKVLRLFRSGARNAWHPAFENEVGPPQSVPQSKFSPCRGRNLLGCPASAIHPSFEPESMRISYSNTPATAVHPQDLPHRPFSIFQFF